MEATLPVGPWQLKHDASEVQVVELPLVELQHDELLLLLLEEEEEETLLAIVLNNSGYSPIAAYTRVESVA